MRIYTDENERLLAVWLTQAEHDDEAVMASLRPVLAQYKSMKYQPVIYRSGSADLKESTAALLCHTRRKMNIQAAAQ